MITNDASRPGPRILNRHEATVDGIMHTYAGRAQRGRHKLAGLSSVAPSNVFISTARGRVPRQTHYRFEPTPANKAIDCQKILNA
jgi:hypothetical protein